MNKIAAVSLLVAIFLGAAALSTSPIWGQGARPVLESTIVPCGPSVNCGGFPQNIATMTPVEGRVIVLASGAVQVELTCNCINQAFEVYFGSFTSSVFQGSPIGTIRTDASGHFGGPIATPTGDTFVFAKGLHSGQFAFNVAGIRTEFVTGFSV